LLNLKIDFGVSNEFYRRFSFLHFFCIPFATKVLAKNRDFVKKFEMHPEENNIFDNAFWKNL